MSDTPSTGCTPCLRNGVRSKACRYPTTWPDLRAYSHASSMLASSITFIVSHCHLKYAVHCTLWLLQIKLISVVLPGFGITPLLFSAATSPTGASNRRRPPSPRMLQVLTEVFHLPSCGFFEQPPAINGGQNLHMAFPSLICLFMSIRPRGLCSL